MSRSFKAKTHLGHLTQAVATLNVYFIDPSRLCSLPDGGPKRQMSTGIELSPSHQENMIDNLGKKILFYSRQEDRGDWFISNPWAMVNPSLGQRLRNTV